MDSLQDKTSDEPRGLIRVGLKIEAFEPCPIHAPTPCACPKVKVGEVCKDDLTCKALAQLIQINILALTSVSITDTANAGHTENANTAASSPLICAGTSGTAAAFADHVLGTETETVAATVNAISSNTFTVTGTITAGADRAYQEVGLRVTVNTHLYLLCHDTFTTLNVSSTGTLGVTYTFTFT